VRKNRRMISISMGVVIEMKMRATSGKFLKIRRLSEMIKLHWGYRNKWGRP
jgi:hypothetical protein